MAREKLSKDVLDQINNAWMGEAYVPDNELFNPFSILRESSEDPDLFWKKFAYLLSSPEYFSFICKHIMGIELLPAQALILHEMWHRKFPMLIASRGFGKTWLLSLYALLRAALIPDRKVVVVGAAFRQSKFLFDYMVSMWNNAPILRELCDQNSGPKKDVDMCRMIINNSVITALPIGDGQKIRGQRANDIIADEFASHSREIFENVIVGFASVKSAPSEGVYNFHKAEKARELGIELQSNDSMGNEIGNQIILSGTAYYDFNHFAEYWQKWCNIIKTKGDKKKITQLFGGDPPPPEFNWKDYSVIRIPIELVPKGFMDEGQVARSKATVHAGIYQMEYSAVFSKDSAGFFKRTLIESCVGTDLHPVQIASGPVFFDPMLKGNPNYKYVMAVDPASERDNFSIVILEIREDHRRLVYCWTTTRKEHVERLKKGLTSIDNFYSYCARKIRELMNSFNTIHIAMDSQGGGISVSEALHDTTQLLPGEVPIWPTIDPDKEKPTDGEPGLHILELCNFAKYDWYSEANHGLRKDMEDKLIIFPRFDPITIGLSIEEDKTKKRLYDTLEDCVMEIEELKNELSIIEVTASVNGRERWDTPEVKVGVGKKERLRKDRYSSLLMGNMAARTIYWSPPPPDYSSYGGFAGMVSKIDKDIPDYRGPAWFTEGMKGVY